MKITYYGHSCFAVEAAGKTLLFDPFITPNPLAKAIDIKTIRADHILISHGHSDHCADAVEIARQTGATIVSNFEVTQWFLGFGAHARAVSPAALVEGVRREIDQMRASYAGRGVLTSARKKKSRAAHLRTKR